MKDEIKEILDKLVQKSISINAGGKGCYNPYNDEKEWSDDIDILLDYITNLQEENKRLNKFVDDILNFYKHNRYEEELTEYNMFKLVLNQNELIMTIEEFKGGK